VSYLIDTNVASEVTKQFPNPSVLAWLAAQPPDGIFLSVITLAEIRYGIEAAKSAAQRTALELWYRASIGGPSAQLLPVNVAIAEAWGRLRRRADLAKRTMPVMDGFIAATAEVHGLIVVTRNVRDFDVWGGPVLNPWREDPPAA
jgi:predicted nucleic acid-binding protein